jgi:hypothetical protein
VRPTSSRYESSAYTPSRYTTRPSPADYSVPSSYVSAGTHVDTAILDRAVERGAHACTHDQSYIGLQLRIGRAPARVLPTWWMIHIRQQPVVLTYSTASHHLEHPSNTTRVIDSRSYENSARGRTVKCHWHTITN